MAKSFNNKVNLNNRKQPGHNGPDYLNSHS
jgi:hypothetical protein